MKMTLPPTANGAVARESRPYAAFIRVCGEKGARLAQNMQVGPCFLVGTQLQKAEVGPTSGPTGRLPHLRRQVEVLADVSEQDGPGRAVRWRRPLRDRPLRHRPQRLERTRCQAGPEDARWLMHSGGNTAVKG
jgi:hypothetical protein